MKTFLSFCAFTLLCISGVSAQTVTNYSTADNLASSNPLACVDLSEVTPDYSAADIFEGIKTCLKEKDFKKAVALYGIGAAYGVFDTRRVKDKTAHQAFSVLSMETFGTLDEESAELMKAEMDVLSNQENETRPAFCSALKKIGPPEYHPTYMISHGMGAFTGSDGNGLVEDFDSEAVWNDVIKNYMKCN